MSISADRRPTKRSAYETDDVRLYRKEAMRAARDLCYGADVERDLRNAKTSAEISRIMATARKEKK